MLTKVFLNWEHCQKMSILIKISMNSMLIPMWAESIFRNQLNSNWIVVDLSCRKDIAVNLLKHILHLYRSKFEPLEWKDKESEIFVLGYIYLIPPFIVRFQIEPRKTYTKHTRSDSIWEDTICVSYRGTVIGLFRNGACESYTWPLFTLFYGLLFCSHIYWRHYFGAEYRCTLFECIDAPNGGYTFQKPSIR